MSLVEPIEWIMNKNKKIDNSEIINKLFPVGISYTARNFHRQISEYNITPLKNLAHLVRMINVSGIWVKDESQRLNLNSFKVLGGSFAIYNF